MVEKPTNMNRQNQYSVFAKLFPQAQHALTVPLVFAFGGWLLPASAIAQAVVERLPPPPEPVTITKSASPSVFTPREIEFEAPQPQQRSATLSSYLVYVSDASSPMLQQVKALEPRAFVREYNGRRIIQAGIFQQDANAKQRAQQLEVKGIGAKIVNLNTGEETNIVSNAKAYFVVIPSSRQNLPVIENRVKQLKINIQSNISQRQQPRGDHVRVGPFAARSQAERWNRYLLDSDIKNARVYFGR